MKKNQLFFTAIAALFFSVSIYSQVSGGGPAQVVLPGDCVSGTSLAPSWHSGNYKLTSSCNDVNVGIGTNTPLYPLHVFGQANVDWLTTQQIGIGTTTSGNVGLEIKSNGSGFFALAHLKQTGASP
jgi:hypothetical protein